MRAPTGHAREWGDQQWRGLASYKLSFLLRPTSPLYAICGAAGARTRRVNEAWNLGPSLVANKMNMPSGV